MRHERHRGHHKERHHREDEHHRRHGSRGGAKTFRRGRALAFLEKLELQRATLKKQLETPELQSINPVLVGELKAIDMIIHEFIETFELHEVEEAEPTEAKTESATIITEKGND